MSWQYYILVLKNPFCRCSHWLPLCTHSLCWKQNTYLCRNEVPLLCCPLCQVRTNSEQTWNSSVLPLPLLFCNQHLYEPKAPLLEIYFKKAKQLSTFTWTLFFFCLSLCNKNGQTAEDLAWSCGFPECAKFLTTIKCMQTIKSREHPNKDHCVQVLTQKRSLGSEENTSGKRKCW